MHIQEKYLQEKTVFVNQLINLNDKVNSFI